MKKLAYSILAMAILALIFTGVLDKVTNSLGGWDAETQKAYWAQIELNRRIIEFNSEMERAQRHLRQ
jgi:hypothetical protein